MLNEQRESASAAQCWLGPCPAALALHPGLVTHSLCCAMIGCCHCCWAGLSVHLWILLSTAAVLFCIALHPQHCIAAQRPVLQTSEPTLSGVVPAGRTHPGTQVCGQMDGPSPGRGPLQASPVP